MLLCKKSTHNDQCLHYSSNHKTDHKESEIYSLFNRACTIIIKKIELRKKTR